MTMNSKHPPRRFRIGILTAAILAAVCPPALAELGYSESVNFPLDTSLTLNLPAPASGPPKSGIMAGDEQTAELLRAEEPKIKQRIKRIGAEIDALNRKKLKDDDWAKEWAGQYYAGDGLGENVRIHLAPKSGIAYLNYGCLGLYGGDHGEVVEALPDGLKFKLVFGKSGGQLSVGASILRPVGRPSVSRSRLGHDAVREQLQ